MTLLERTLQIFDPLVTDSGARIVFAIFLITNLLLCYIQIKDGLINLLNGKRIGILQLFVGFVCGAITVFAIRGF